VIVRVHERYFRPTEVDTLLGDPSRARERLGWEPQISTDRLIEEMVAEDLEAARKHALLKQFGYGIAVTRED
jgi:GDPmannose 4,6-dehydratase